MAVFRGHTGRVNAVVLSWDGKFVASAGDDSLVKIWDMATHKLTTTLRGHAGPVLSLACAFSSQQLASGGLDRTVRLWRLPEGELFRTLQGHHGGVYSLAYSLDGRSLFSGGADRRVWQWDNLLGQAWDVYSGFKDAAGAVAVSMDKKTLAVGTLDGSLELRPVEPLPKFLESDFERGSTRKSSAKRWRRPVNGQRPSSTIASTRRLPPKLWSAWPVHCDFYRLLGPSTADGGPTGGRAQRNCSAPSTCGKRWRAGKHHRSFGHRVGRLLPRLGRSVPIGGTARARR